MRLDKRAVAPVSRHFDLVQPAQVQPGQEPDVKGRSKAEAGAEVRSPPLERLGIVLLSEVPKDRAEPEDKAIESETMAAVKGMLKSEPLLLKTLLTKENEHTLKKAQSF
jgi:hypothetical protein